MTPSTRKSSITDSFRATVADRNHYDSLYEGASIAFRITMAPAGSFSRDAAIWCRAGGGRGMNRSDKENGRRAARGGCLWLRLLDL